MTLLLIYLFIALFTSFLCSVMEAVLLSTPISYLKSKLDQEDKGAHAMLKLKENVDKPLSAILSLNTVAHTVGAAGVGAQAVVVFGDAYFGIVSAVLTILILVLTEIIPKTIGANYSKELVNISAKVINVMIFFTYPLVVMSSVLTKLLSRNTKELTTSREKISALFDAWDLMLSKKEHISIVTDLYGGMDGIATLEDIIESLLGFEIVDEKDRVEDMQQYAMERWKSKQKKYNLLKDKNENSDALY